MTTSENKDIVNISMNEMRKSLEIAGSLLLPITEKIGKTGVIFLSHEIQRIRRKYHGL
jgi:hypothetical protein